MGKRYSLSTNLTSNIKYPKNSHPVWKQKVNNTNWYHFESINFDKKVHLSNISRGVPTCILCEVLLLGLKNSLGDMAIVSELEAKFLKQRLPTVDGSEIVDMVDIPFWYGWWKSG